MTLGKVFVAGHRGMVGSAILRRLEARAAAGEAITPMTRSRAMLDLTDAGAVRAFMQAERPDAVVLAAARVGGILANRDRPAEFIRDNLAIECNVIHAAHETGVRRLLNLGSSCIYPRGAPQPMREEALLTGPLEPTNEPYAIAKIAGIKLCESYNRQHGTDFRSIMPTNLYGPGDNFDAAGSHVLPALIRRFDRARQAGADEVTIWGTGTPRREFLHVDDLADAALFVLDLPKPAWDTQTAPMRSHVNIGTGRDLTIRELAGLVAAAAGYTGRIGFDPGKPDGAPRKLLDVSRMASLGWRARIPLEQGIRETWRWYLDNEGARRD